MAPLSVEEIRRRVIKELVDLEIVSARRLPLHHRVARRVRRRLARLR